MEWCCYTQGNVAFYCKFNWFVTYICITKIIVHVYLQKCFPKVSVKGESSADVPKGRVKGRPSKRTKSKLVEEPGK